MRNHIYFTFSLSVVLFQVLHGPRGASNELYALNSVGECTASLPTSLCLFDLNFEQTTFVSRIFAVNNAIKTMRATRNQPKLRVLWFSIP